VVGALSKSERRALNDLLRRLVLEFERRQGPLKKARAADA
jgi:hypothetical protein